MTDIGWLHVGKVLSCHGLAGWLKVSCFTPALLDLCSRWLDKSWELSFRLIPVGGEPVLLRLRGVRPLAQPPLFAFEGIEGLEQARPYHGSGLWLLREELPPCSEGEFFYADLEGCDLVWQAEAVARVRAVVEAGASVLLEVERAGRCYLVPFVASFIGEVDLAQKQIELKNFWILE